MGQVHVHQSEYLFTKKGDACTEELLFLWREDKRIKRGGCAGRGIKDEVEGLNEITTSTYFDYSK